MSVNQSKVSATSSKASTSEPLVYQDGVSLASVHDGYMANSATPVGETSPPKMDAAPGCSEGRVIGLAPAWRATSLTCGSTGAGVRNRNLYVRKKRIQLMRDEFDDDRSYRGEAFVVCEKCGGETREIRNLQ